MYFICFEYFKLEVIYMFVRVFKKINLLFFYYVKVFIVLFINIIGNYIFNEKLKFFCYKNLSVCKVKGV